MSQTAITATATDYSRCRGTVCGQGASAVCSHRPRHSQPSNISTRPSMADNVVNPHYTMNRHQRTKTPSTLKNKNQSSVPGYLCPAQGTAPRLIYTKHCRPVALLHSREHKHGQEHLYMPDNEQPPEVNRVRATHESSRSQRGFHSKYEGRAVKNSRWFPYHACILMMRSKSISQIEHSCPLIR